MERMSFTEYVYKIYGGIGVDDLTDDDYDFLYREWEEYCRTGVIDPKF